MDRIARLISQLAAEMKPLLRHDPAAGTWTIHDDELGEEASCCTTIAAAALFALDARLGGRPDQLEIASGLAEDVRRRQLPSGAFSQPFYVRKGEANTIDIAEIGASANSLYLVHQATGSQAAKISLVASADYLLTQVAAENPAAIYKNPNAKNHDVLNGDMYAAHTFGRAYELTGNRVYLDKASEIVAHLIRRFGVHSVGWWPYTENWDGSVGMGNSVSYQATIVTFAHPLKPLLPPALRKEWEPVSLAATERILTALADGPNDDNEAPWWCRDWDNVPEILLTLSHYPALPEAKRYVTERLDAVEAGLGAKGLQLFEPKVRHNEPDRTPVTTTFRKAATMAAVLGHLAAPSLVQAE